MNSNPVLIDVRGVLDAEEAKQKGLCYRTLWKGATKEENEWRERR